MQQSKSYPRFLGLDIFRLLAMFAIAVYHCHEFYYSEVSDPFPGATLWESFRPLYYPYARAMSISGIIIVVLSGFLYGQKSNTGNSSKGFLTLCLIGFGVLFITQGDTPFIETYLDWDIYAFLLIAAFSVAPFRRWPKYIGVLVIAGFILLWIPFWEFAWVKEFPLTSRYILFGKCDGDGRGGWGLFPWIGLVWTSFGLGYFFRRNQGWQVFLSSFTKKEFIFWLLLLPLSWKYFGFHYDVPIDHRFYCFIFRQPVFAFWSNFIWVILVIRLCLLESVNQYLHSKKWAQKVGKLYWSKKFGVCYLVSLIILTWAFYVDTMSPRLYDFYILSLMPITEMIVWSGYKLYQVMMRATSESTKTNS